MLDFVSGLARACATLVATALVESCRGRPSHPSCITRLQSRRWCYLPRNEEAPDPTSPRCPVRRREHPPPQLLALRQGDARRAGRLQNKRVINCDECLRATADASQPDDSAKQTSDPNRQC